MTKSIGIKGSGLDVSWSCVQGHLLIKLVMRQLLFLLKNPGRPENAVLVDLYLRTHLIPTLLAGFVGTIPPATP